MTTYLMIYLLLNASLVWLYRNTFDEALAKYVEEHQYTEKQEKMHRTIVAGLAVFFFLPVLVLVAIKMMVSGGE